MGVVLVLLIVFLGSAYSDNLCAQQKANGTNVACSSDGNFLPKQCQPGACWCVDTKTGVEVPGSRKVQGTANSRDVVDCGSSSVPLCKQQVKNGTTPAPKCSADGNFEPKQCLPGACWCVDRITGVEFPGSRKTQGTANSKPVDCQPFDRSSVAGGKCKQQAQNQNGTNPPLRCTPDGNFEPKQCQPGACWCVDRLTGVEFPGSRRTQGTANSKPVECQAFDRSSVAGGQCKNQVQNGTNPPLSCSPDGNYEPKQCMPGSCWCVDVITGVQIPGSLQVQGTVNSKPVQCGLSTVIPLCKQQLRNGTTPPPTCSADGNFEPKQCQPGACWCVDRQTGVEFPGSRQTQGTANSKPVDCGAPVILPLCHQQVQSGKTPAPSCSSDGNFEPIQCIPGSCWCVNTVTGEELPGTRKSAGTANSSPPTCSTKPCLQRSKGNDTIKPTCTKEGNFEPMQCIPGSCWCVNPISGEEITGTRKVAGAKNSEKPKCSDKLCVILSQTRDIKPQCNPDGSFQAQQCRPGYCYCVNTTTGEEIPGTGRMIGTDGGSQLNCGGPGPAPGPGPLRGAGD